MNDAICMIRDAIGLAGITIEDDNNKIPTTSKKLDIKNSIFYKKII